MSKNVLKRKSSDAGKSKKKKKPCTKCTLLINVDGDEDFYPCQYKPGTMDWIEFQDLILSKTDIDSNRRDISVKFTQQIGSKKFQSHLTASTFAEFNKYAKKSYEKNPDEAIELKVKKMPPKDVCVSLISHGKPSKEVHNHGESTDDIDEIIAGFQEKNWEKEYVQSFNASIRQKAFKKLLEPSMHSGKCTTCKNHHNIKTINTTKLPDTFKLESLLTRQEARALVEKRSIIQTIYGNSNILINCLYVQCPICGNLLSLGHFNDIGHRKDNLYSHIKSVHFNDPIRSTERASGYLCMKRHEQYFQNNKNIDLPLSERCPEGLHKVLPVEVVGVRGSPWDKGNMKLHCPKLPDDLFCHHVIQSETLDTEDNLIDLELTSKARLTQNEFSVYAMESE